MMMQFVTIWNVYRCVLVSVERVAESVSCRWWGGRVWGVGLHGKSRSTLRVEVKNINLQYK